MNRCSYCGALLTGVYHGCDELAAFLWGFLWKSPCDYAVMNAHQFALLRKKYRNQMVMEDDKKKLQQGLFATTWALGEWKKEVKIYVYFGRNLSDDDEVLVYNESEWDCAKHCVQPTQTIQQ